MLVSTVAIGGTAAVAAGPVSDAGVETASSAGPSSLASQTAGDPTPHVVSPSETPAVSDISTADGPPDAALNESAPITHRVTLVTGETVTVVESGNETEYRITDAEGRYMRYGDENGMYIIPEHVDRDVYDEELFNVTRLVEMGLTADRVDGTPVIVEYADGAAAADAGGDSFAIDHSFERINAAAGTMSAESPGTDVAATSAAPIERIYLDRQLKAHLDGLPEAIGAVTARQANGVNGSGVNVSIIDSGIDSDHPDFGNRVIIETNYVDEDENTTDVRGHGTHVAGIAAGEGTESNGQYVGIAPGANLFDKRALDDEGSGALSDIVAAIEDSVDQEADVISMSLGGPLPPDNPLNDAVAAAHDEGVIVVTSAGNSGPSDGTISAPGNAPEAITVGASDPTDRFYEENVAGFSSRGPTATGGLKPDVVAPGVFVVAPGSKAADEYPYTEKSGTSMSAPMVSGTVALMLEANGDMSPEEVRSALTTTAHRFDDAGVYDQGAGQINATAALNASLFVEKPTLGFGEIEFNESATESFTIENRGDEPMNLSLSTALTGPNGEAGTVEVTPESPSLAPGESTTVEITITADVDAPGRFSGVLTYEDATTGATFRSVFGYQQAPDLSDVIVIEKEPLDDRDIAGETVRVESHDGEQSESYEFDEDGQVIVSPQTDANMTIWTAGREAATDDPIMMPTVIDPEEYTGETLTFDETETVEYEFNTSAIENERGDLHNRMVSASMYLDVQPDSFFGSYSLSLTSVGIGLNHTGTAHFGETPDWATDPEEQTYTSLQRVVVPQDTHDPWETGGIQNPYVYDLLTFTENVDGPVTEAVDPADLQRLNNTYQRDSPAAADELSVSHLFEPDREWTGPVSTVINQELGEQTNQTYYTSTGDLRSSFGITTEYDTESGETLEWDQTATDRVADVGTTDRFVFNEHPAVNRVDETSGTIVDSDTIYQAGWFLADQPAGDDSTRRPYELGFGADTSYEVTHNGDVIAAEENVGGDYTVSVTGNDMPALADGDVVGIGLKASELSPLHEVVTDYEVEYQSGDVNQPPEIADVRIEGLDDRNSGLEGLTTIEVVVEDHVTGTPDAFSAHYADGDINHTPFADAAGWSAANVEHRGNGSYEFTVPLAATDGLSLAVRAVDEEGNIVETTTFDVASWADAPATPVSGQPGRVDSGDDIQATLDADGLTEIKTELHADSTVSEDELTLYQGTSVNAFGEWRAYDPALDDDDYPLIVETDADTVGSVVLEHTFRGTNDTEVTLVTGPTAVYDKPLVVGDSPNATVATIQEAVDLAPPNATIYVENGTYEEAVTVETDGLTIMPVAGAQPTIIAPESAAAAVRVAGAHNVTVEDLQIAAGGADGVVVTDDAIESSVNAPTLTDIHVENADRAVAVQEASAPTVTNVTVANATTGVGFESATEPTATDLTIGASETGVAFDGGTAPYAADVTVTGAGEGVAFGNTPMAQAEGVTAEDVGVGVAVADTTELTLSDATVTNASGDAVQVVGANTSVSVSGLTATAVQRGIHAAGGAHAHTTESIVTNASVGIRVADGATAEATLTTFAAAVGAQFDGADAAASTVHHNDFSGSELVAETAANETVDLRLNYVGERAGGETIVDGDVVYDPFLTSAPEAVDLNRTDIGTDLQLASGTTYTVGVPGPTAQNVSEAFTDFDGAIYAYDEATDSWTLASGDDDLEALDAFAVVPAEDTRVVLTFEATDETPPAPGAATLDEGWNFVAAPQYDGVENAFSQSTADVGLATGLMESPHSQLGEPSTLDGTHEFDGGDGPHVSAFEGVFVFVDESGQQPAYLSSDPTLNQLYTELGLTVDLDNPDQDHGDSDHGEDGSASESLTAAGVVG